MAINEVSYFYSVTPVHDSRIKLNYIVLLTSFVHKTERYYCGNKLVKEKIKIKMRTLNRVISDE